VKQPFHLLVPRIGCLLFLRESSGMILSHWVGRVGFRSHDSKKASKVAQGQIICSVADDGWCRMSRTPGESQGAWSGGALAPSLHCLDLTRLSQGSLFGGLYRAPFERSCDLQMLVLVWSSRVSG